jgi:hypothetical protein
MFAYSLDDKTYITGKFNTKFKAIVQAIRDHDLKEDDYVFVKEEGEDSQRFTVTSKQIKLSVKKTAV